MSNQRVCDVNGEIINPLGNEFYTVSEGKGGGTKDICYQCARSVEASWWVPWTADTIKGLANRVRPSVASGASNNGRAYDVITEGTTGSVEPTWLTTVGDTVTDGSVVYLVNLAPLGNVAVRNGMLGNAGEVWSLWGWMTGAHEVSGDLA